MSADRVVSVSTVERDGTVGGDGAHESWSVQVVFEGLGTWTYYSYPVYMPDRFSDWQERQEDGREDVREWDVESVGMSDDDDMTEYTWETLNGCETLEDADAVAKADAEHTRGIYLSEMERQTTLTTTTEQEN